MLQRRAHACRFCLRLASTHASLGPSVASASSLSHEKINLPRYPNNNLGELDPPGKAHALTSPAAIAAPYSVARGGVGPAPSVVVRQNMPRVAMSQRGAAYRPCCPQPRTRLECYDRLQKSSRPRGGSEVFRGPSLRAGMGEPIDMQQSGCLYRAPTCWLRRP